MTPRCSLLFLALFLSLPAAARLPRNEVSLAAGWTDLARYGGDRTIGAGYTRYWHPAVATQLGVSVAGDRFMSVHLTAEYHARRERTFSPWGGLGIARRAFDAGDAEETNVGLIAAGGVDLNVTPRFAIGGQLHYSRLVTDEGDRFEANVHPTTITIAARWRY
jgi:opacity protein-like surface antigen